MPAPESKVTPDCNGAQIAHPVKQGDLNSESSQHDDLHKTSSPHEIGPEL